MLPISVGKFEGSWGVIASGSTALILNEGARKSARSSRGFAGIIVEPTKATSEAGAEDCRASGADDCNHGRMGPPPTGRTTRAAWARQVPKVPAAPVGCPERRHPSGGIDAPPVHGLGTERADILCEPPLFRPPPTG